MDVKDIILIPIYLFLIYFAAIIIRSVYYSNHELKKYFLPGLTVKLLGALFVDFIYLYYYGGGDTLNYFAGTKVFMEAFQDSFSVFVKLLFTGSHNYNDPEVNYYLIQYWMFRESASFLLIKIASIFSLFSFNSYVIMSLLFAFFSFFGSWALLRTFYDFEPALKREFAIACLFIPSVFFWGSGLFKDTITMAALGYLTYSTYQVFIKRKFHPKYFIAIIICSYLIIIIKTYIILSFLGPALLLIFLTYKSQIRSKVLNYFLTPFILGIAVLLGFLLIQQLGSLSSAYSLEMISKKAYDTQWWHSTVQKLYGDEGGGSFYSLGAPDASFQGMIRKIPLAINVTLFRPYIWEISSTVLLLAGIESLLIFIFTIHSIWRAGIIKFFKLIFNTPFISFCLLFALILAFGVGLTSYNFGALARYKIPCMPFFISALFLIKYYAKPAYKDGYSNSTLQPA